VVSEIDINQRLILIAIDCYRLSVYRLTMPGKSCCLESVYMLPGVSIILGDVLLKPIIEAAGKDITHWFDKKTKDVCFISVNQ